MLHKPLFTDIVYFRMLFIYILSLIHLPTLNIIFCHMPDITHNQILASPSDVPICKKSPIRFPIRSHFFFFFLIFSYKGIALPNNMLQSILKSEKNWKSFFFFLKSQKSWKSSEWLELPNSDFKGCFSLFVPKVGFFLYFKTCSFRLCQQKKSIIWRYIAKMRSRSPLKGRKRGGFRLRAGHYTVF